MVYANYISIKKEACFQLLVTQYLISILVNYWDLKNCNYCNLKNQIWHNKIGQPISHIFFQTNGYTKVGIMPILSYVGLFS